MSLHLEKNPEMLLRCPQGPQQLSAGFLSSNHHGLWLPIKALVSFC